MAFHSVVADAVIIHGNTILAPRVGDIL